MTNSIRVILLFASLFTASVARADEPGPDFSQFAADFAAGGAPLAAEPEPTPERTSASEPTTFILNRPIGEPAK